MATSLPPPTKAMAVLTEDHEADVSPTRPQNWLMRNAKAIEVIAQIFVIISVILILVASWIQIQANLDVTRRQTTSALVTLSFSNPIFDAKALVATEMSTNAPVFAKVANASKAEGDDEQVALLQQTLLTPELRHAFVTLAEFYNSVVACQESGACHNALTDSFFLNDMCGFVPLYQDFAKQLIDEQYGVSVAAPLESYHDQKCSNFSNQKS